MEDKIRLQVAISRSGYCSRRKAMDLIQEGRVQLEGQVVTEPSTPVDPQKANIIVNGKKLEMFQYSYILFNKPVDCVTTRQDRFREKTIYDYLPKEFRRLVPVGRLDKDTEGLLLLTNDGDLAFHLTHPKFDCEKVYLVRVWGELVEENVRKLESGVNIEKKKTRPAEIRDVSLSKGQTQFIITIHEGRKRQIRLMLKSVGHTVIYLKRIAQGPLEIGALKVGQYRALTNEEIEKLKKL